MATVLQWMVSARFTWGIRDGSANKDDGKARRLKDIFMLFESNNEIKNGYKKQM